MTIGSFLLLISLTSKDEQNPSCLFQLEWDAAGPSASPRSYSTSAASFFARSGNCCRSKEKWDQSASHLMQSSLIGIKRMILNLFVILPFKNISPVQFFPTTRLEKFVTALLIVQKYAASVKIFYEDCVHSCPNCHFYMSGFVKLYWKPQMLKQSNNVKHIEVFCKNKTFFSPL